jgi:multicomponent Na+:H+ antiporter subunit D
MAEAGAVDLARALVAGPTPIADWAVILPVVLPLLGGAAALVLREHLRLQQAIAVAVFALLVLVDAALLARVAADGPVTMMMGRWLPPFGIAFTVDVLGATFALATAVVAVLAAAYAGCDIDAARRRFGFFPFLMLLVAGVSGAFLTGDIFNLYVWFEVLLISSFGLVVLGGEPRQIDGAVKYGILNLIATTLFLVATGYLYGLVGTLNMADIVAAVRRLPPDGPIGTIAALYLLAFGMKAAAFPVNFWLPASYHTPRIVVAAVFAGLLTKVGVYALLRTLVMLMPAERLALADVIGWVAGLTMVLAALAALGQGEVRRALGFLVISGIGAMLAGLSIASEAALTGTVIYAVHSILAMTAIYLAVGAMEQLAGSSSLSSVGGLYKASPLLAALFLVLAFAVSGLPPFSGFWPKVVLVRAALAAGEGWLAAAVLVSGFLTTLALGRIWLLAFWRPLPAGAAAPPAATLTAAAVGPILAFALLVTALGLLPEDLVRLAAAGAAGLLDPTAYIDSVFPSMPAGGAPP